MRYTIAIALMLLATSPVMAAEIYRCQGENGETIFSDEPCSEQAESLNVEPAPTTETARQVDDNAAQSNGNGNGNGNGNKDGQAAAKAQTEESPAPRDTDASPTESSNPCLKPNEDGNKALAAGVAEARIRSICGKPQRVTSERDLFDRTLHYTDGERGVRIFIRDGQKVGHTTN